MDMHDEDFLLQFDMLIWSFSWSLLVSGRISNSNNRSSKLVETKLCLVMVLGSWLKCHCSCWPCG